MRLLTFSFLKNCKNKSLWFHNAKNLRIDSIRFKALDIVAGDPKLIEIHPSWKEDEEPELRAAMMSDMQVLPDFVTETEEMALVAELEPYLKRMRYEFDHWDNAIEGFRETERTQWSAASAAVLSRARAAAFRAPDAAEPLPHVHVLDLAAAGHIRPHVDSVRFCGDVIAGISLLSDAVMRLRHEQRPHLQLDALLPRRSLYIMRGSARYLFAHAVLARGESAWRGRRVARARRIALITRSRPRTDLDR